ncbi:hypothetical protein E5990_07015 [Muribaculum caecicola]|uniref:Uncharacterized protein n=1 Tax=Muribaculum caecicola TaxID=3038144 RepID=A0AC61S4Q0_9BACT|nr:hypothetical protein [Muribaculum caecicola]THG49456.1 hypothetical protein E5990_07015 [Muribaculum caecicola]
MAVKTVPENVEFLTQWNGFELPKGILNKGVTGCGATSVAIEDEHKTIICSPRINLIKNKVAQHEELLGVYGDVKNDEIIAYLEKAETPKIMVTYDSMPRLAKLIEDRSDWRVVVDEYQYLLIDSGFRSDKAIALLDAVNEFDYVTYLSATPIADKYIQKIEHFRNMPFTELKWSDEKFERIKVKRIVSSRPINNAIEIVRNYQNGIFPTRNGVVSKECVIFLNSVTNIANIINQTKLPPEDVNIIVARTEENISFFKRLGYEIGTIPLKEEPHKKFTFCTSTAFAGCDFYSECASTFVISDNKKVHTSIDIATELVQIVGRQRLMSNPFRKEVVFIYNVDIGENNADIYKKSIEKKLKDSEDLANWNNSVPERFREKVGSSTNELQRIKKYSQDYVRYDENSDSFTVNHWAYLNDCFAFDVQHKNYENSIVVKKQLDDNRFDTSPNEEVSDYMEQLKCILVKEGFADRMKRYCELRQLKESCKFYLASDIMERQYEDLRLYYDRLGKERIKALGFKEKDLKNELERSYRANDIKQKFRETFIVGQRMATEDIKKIMSEIYSVYGINKRGVATHLERDYDIRVKPIKVTTPNGLRKGGYEFI